MDPRLHQVNTLSSPFHTFRVLPRSNPSEKIAENSRSCEPTFEFKPEFAVPGVLSACPPPRPELPNATWFSKVNDDDDIQYRFILAFFSISTLLPFKLKLL